VRIYKAYALRTDGMSAIIIIVVVIITKPFYLKVTYLRRCMAAKEHVT
jgi:hypothetical protein